MFTNTAQTKYRFFKEVALLQEMDCPYDMALEKVIARRPNRFFDADEVEALKAEARKTDPRLGRTWENSLRKMEFLSLFDLEVTSTDFPYKRNVTGLADYYRWVVQTELDKQNGRGRSSVQHYLYRYHLYTVAGFIDPARPAYGVPELSNYVEVLNTAFQQNLTNRLGFVTALQDSGIFSDLVVEHISYGMQTGSLPEALWRLFNYLESEWDDSFVPW